MLRVSRAEYYRWVSSRKSSRIAENEAIAEKIEKCVQKGKEDELVKLVHDRDKNVRLAAIAGLGRAGKDNDCNVLITLLLDDDPEIRSASASALGDLGEDVYKRQSACFSWEKVPRRDITVPARLLNEERAE